MNIPVVVGVIDRRILVNYRVNPDVLKAILPPPFRPKLINDYGMAGVCLIRLKNVRPRGYPPWIGFSSENAAHRVAVEWEENGGTRDGVFIPRRDTSSWLNAAVGGRLFPGEHHHATFRVNEGGGRYRVDVESDDGITHLAVDGRVAPALPEGSCFRSLAEASAFFERGFLGYSVTSRADEFDGLELRCAKWRVEPLAVERVQSSFFDDPNRFPPGSVAFDCALLMEGVDHAWHGRGLLRGRIKVPCAPSAASG
jgi:hypothetical protein